MCWWNGDSQELIDEQDNAGNEEEFAMDSNASLTEVFVLLSKHYFHWIVSVVLFSLFLPLIKHQLKSKEGQGGGGWGRGAEHLKIKVGSTWKPYFGWVLCFSANILFKFQAVKNLYAHPIYLCFGPFCKFLGDF